jgi:energy-coupling factor transporter ATP-binding protein EcfA2
VRLSKLKLAGFKTFVDPTTIQMPGQLVGVVGPNGCGKSNIIDAVRWVLGESRASALRGDAMTDVIFNGSGTRKPVGRASVELVFDNNQGRAAGQWSQYAEIAVKRVLERDGQSDYFINNTRCRRRDVIDVFLGTGLGPRAYAIIEQGMITRIIEARPEELRAFLEEAAGITKYRERRRETQGRLDDARDNLIRLDDIVGELGSRIDRLQKQAEVAARYTGLNTAPRRTPGAAVGHEAADSRRRSRRAVERRRRGSKPTSSARQRRCATMRRRWNRCVQNISAVPKRCMPRRRNCSPPIPKPAGSRRICGALPKTVRSCRRASPSSTPKSPAGPPASLRSNRTPNAGPRWPITRRIASNRPKPATKRPARCCPTPKPPGRMPNSRRLWHDASWQRSSSC